MADLDRLLHPEVADAAADAAHVPSFDAIERRGRVLRRRRTTVLVGATAALAAVVVLGLRSWVPGPEGAAPLPPAGSPTRAEVLAPAADPQRVVRPVPGDGEGRVGSGWTDPADTASGVVDIHRLDVGNFGGGSGPDWSIELAAPYPTEAALDAERRVVEYGVVIDSDLDGVGDCEIGINNDNDSTTEPGAFRVWVKNLRDGHVDERVGGPYGLPIDFSHPGERGPEAAGAEEQQPRMGFFFLDSTPTPCDGYGDDDNVRVWAQLTEDGRVLERDAAPDDAWLRVP